MASTSPSHATPPAPPYIHIHHQLHCRRNPSKRPIPTATLTFHSHRPDIPLTAFAIRLSSASHLHHVRAPSLSFATQAGRPPPPFAGMLPAIGDPTEEDEELPIPWRAVRAVAAVAADDRDVSGDEGSSLVAEVLSSSPSSLLLLTS